MGVSRPPKSPTRHAFILSRLTDATPAAGSRRSSPKIVLWTDLLLPPDSHGEALTVANFPKEVSKVRGG